MDKKPASQTQTGLPDPQECEWYQSLRVLNPDATTQVFRLKTEG